MSVSSTKNRSRSNPVRAAIAAAWLLGLPAHALESKYEVRFQSQLGYHLVAPQDLAVHRDVLRAEVRWKGGEESPWSAVAGLRAYVEGAFATNPGHYGGQVAQLESAELVPRNLYLQYEQGPWQFRLGNQQVVWGEAFGFYYADIVNPKDLRQFALGDLEDFRLPTPMLNARWIRQDFSLQVICIPKPFFDKVPAQGSDFAIPFGTYVPGATFTVTDPRSGPLALDTAEYGARATALLGGVDTSLFFLSYQDRMPVYSASLVSLVPTVVHLEASHPRLWTLGATATADLGAFLLRAEALYSRNRSFNTLNGLALAVAQSDELVGVLGVDYTQLEKWQLGVQVSEDYLTRSLDHVVADRSGAFLSLRAHGTIWRDHSLDLVFGIYPSDGSTVTEAGYDIPLSNQMVLGVGADWLEGSPTSRLGPYRRGSRAFVVLHGYFNG